MTKTGSILLSVAEPEGDSHRGPRRVEFASMGDGTVAVSIYMAEETSPASVALISQDDLIAAAKALCILLAHE